MEAHTDFLQFHMFFAHCFYIVSDGSEVTRELTEFRGMDLKTIHFGYNSIAILMRGTGNVI